MGLMGIDGLMDLHPCIPFRGEIWIPIIRPSVRLSIHPFIHPFTRFRFRFSVTWIPKNETKRTELWEPSRVQSPTSLDFSRHPEWRRCTGISFSISPGKVLIKKTGVDGLERGDGSGIVSWRPSEKMNGGIKIVKRRAALEVPKWVYEQTDKELVLRFPIGSERTRR